MMHPEQPVCSGYYTWKEYKEGSHFSISLRGITNNRFEVARVSIDSENSTTSTDIFTTDTMLKANSMFRSWVGERL